MSPDDPGTCGDGSSGGGGGTPPEPTIAELVAQYTQNIQYVINAVDDQDIVQAYDGFMDLLPGDLVYEYSGTYVVGIYASLGGLWLGGSNLIPAGGTIGLQVVVDAYGDIAFQLFIGAGIHVLPHAEVVAYRMDYYDTIPYTALEGGSAQISGALAGAGVTGEYIFVGGYSGMGYSVSLINLNLNIPLSLVVEVQYTTTLWASDWN
jgi:hypothetical protein